MGGFWRRKTSQGSWTQLYQPEAGLAWGGGRKHWTDWGSSASSSPSSCKNLGKGLAFPGPQLLHLQKGVLTCPGPRGFMEHRTFSAKPTSI